VDKLKRNTVKAMYWHFCNRKDLEKSLRISEANGKLKFSKKIQEKFNPKCPILKKFQPALLFYDPDNSLSQFSYFLPSFSHILAIIWKTLVF
jgi:hypothetical protein